MKKKTDMTTKGVSFNVLDPDQKKLLDHAMKRKNFSAYVKRLIQRDIDNAFVPKAMQNENPSSAVNVDEGHMEELI